MNRSRGGRINCVARSGLNWAFGVFCDGVCGALFRDRGGGGDVARLRLESKKSHCGSDAHNDSFGSYFEKINHNKKYSRKFESLHVMIWDE